MPQGKAHIGTGQCMTPQRLQAMRQLGGGGLQKFSPRWCAEKQFFHFHRGAHRPRHRTQLATAGIELHGVVLLRGARQHAEFRHSGNGGQGLAAKAHGGHGFKVVQVADLAGGVASQGQGHVSGFQTRAIVFHADEPHTAFLQTHHHLGGACVQGVVHQFAHHRCGAFNHFASGDLADQFVGEFTDGASCQGREIHACHSRGVPAAQEPLLS